ncbi:MAG: glutamate synthase large subunit [Clostridiales bacterium]|nr:glutamate synthase large subunit [Clostridiales bacterium]
MVTNGYPHKQGLYNPKNEHDACGIGAVVNIDGRRSHKVVSKALQILINLEHRGASGSDENSGDGAGILIQIPHVFFKKVAKQMKFSLPKQGKYGVGMFFFPQDIELRQHCQYIFEQAVANEGQTFLGWRSLPLEYTCLGPEAYKCMPYIMQAFIGSKSNINNEMDMERKLYIIRKQTENTLKREKIDSFYISSLSSRTIVYKGMLLADQVGAFYKDLTHPSVKSAIALVHSRYSTNTFPSWERAHPNRYIIHNGEINTLHGNVNWVNARKSMLDSKIFGDDLTKVYPIINSEGSDSAMFDNSMEFLHLSGRSLAHSAMMMIPEPWSKSKIMPKYKKDFYEFHSCLMEPWDGPASIVFSDGKIVGAVLDRNGLRPSRYYVTTDNTLILASEVGVLDLEEDEILYKERLRPGRMLLVDTEKGCIIGDEELKKEIATEKPYGTWLKDNMKTIDKLIPFKPLNNEKIINLNKLQCAFGYTYEDVTILLKTMAATGKESIGAMGNDAPLAVLSDKPQMLYNYFKQLFAQVTNPPIDAIREEIVTGTEMYIGSQQNLLQAEEKSVRQIKIDGPILTNEQLHKLEYIQEEGFKSATLPTVFTPDESGEGLKEALYRLFDKADQAIEENANILILSDKSCNAIKAPIPALLAASGLHHHLIKTGKRTRVSIIVQSGEPREVHHFAVLIGYGASAINPYLAFESVKQLHKKTLLGDITLKQAEKNIVKAITTGIVKVMSKMGISTLLSYQGAQIFEALGISEKVIKTYFTGTPSRIKGMSLEDIAKEVIMRHKNTYHMYRKNFQLDVGGDYRYRSNGEYHLYNPKTIHLLQMACRSGKYEQFTQYSNLINQESRATLRSLMDFNSPNDPIPLEKVESIDDIVKRFKTGAMSYGSISQETHETLAIAMNRLHGKSNTGEGGEIVDRFINDSNGDSRCSAIKQVASGRFGVTSHYLVNSQEIQIKMAQGAKPGEGGQLPGKKVYPWIAKARLSTPGVGLISPPPHHDIYSIEDLSQLIHDLKMANSQAEINVKLVSEVGVGTIAAGVAKGKADVILISGYDGGTGAAPRTSMKHTGLPWELGLAETNQTLILNNLRDRVKLETDGKLMTGRDVVIATLLGAEEFGFSTAPLIAIGCVMMRVCNLDTCPVGVATQNPELRKNFNGKPEYIENFMRFIAKEMREIMASLGFSTINDMVGQTSVLTTKDLSKNFKTAKLDLSSVFYSPKLPEGSKHYRVKKQDHKIDKTFDARILDHLLHDAIASGKPTTAILPIRNTDRDVGTFVGSKISRIYADKGLKEDTITLHLKGSAGQSFGAFIPTGMTLILDGDSNDYVGKGLSGGKIIVKCPDEAIFKAEENIIIGNVAFYGATKGEAYINGIAGERFCVRNSGVHAVVEGVGDHGCEYMTGGKVVVLGSVGRNFAAGMSGGIAYVYNRDDTFKDYVNQEMVLLEEISSNEEADTVRSMIKKHYNYTGSLLAERLLDAWEETLENLVKVIPIEYKAITEHIKLLIDEGLNEDDANLQAFRASVTK